MSSEVPYKTPPLELELYELAQKSIFAETSIESSIYYQGVLKLASSIKLSRVSEKVIKYVKKIYFKNLELFVGVWGSCSLFEVEIRNI